MKKKKFDINYKKSAKQDKTIKSATDLEALKNPVPGHTYFTNKKGDIIDIRTPKNIKKKLKHSVKSTKILKK